MTYPKAVRLPAYLFAVAVTVQVCQAKALQTGSQQPTQPFEALEQQAKAALAQNRTGEAIALLERGVRVMPDWREGWWGLGKLLYQADQYTSARQALARLVELDPKSGPGWVVLGLCDFELRDYRASRNHIARGLALGIPLALGLVDVARYHQALALIVDEKYEQAQLVLNNFARRGIHSDEVMVAYGLAALRIPALPPTLPRVMDSRRISMVREVGEAEFLAASGRRAEAHRQYDGLIERYPAEPYLHYAYGSTLCNAFDFEKAGAQFRQELQINPQSVAARLGLAFVGIRTGSVPDAVILAQEAVRLDPKSFMAHLFLGSLLAKAGKLEEGARELETSRDLEPDSSHVRYALAHAYERLDRKDDALREQRAFERLKPLEEPLPFGKAPSSFSPSEPPAGAESKTGSSDK
jgi:tetratricopeptide (TPR) repeat protein